jgi:hypothetical protein
MTEWIDRNPFLDDFLKEEVEWYGKPDGIKMIRPRMRCDDYLNVNFRLDPGFDVPILVRDGTIWMSLTWMEVQSAWPAIWEAQGRAATIGLGLGYFALRAVEKPDVETLTVFEQDAENIKWFRKNFEHRPGFQKIKFVHGDARKTCKGFEFETMFADPYPTLGADEVIEDARVFKSENFFARYRFWTYERCVADAFEHHGLIGAEDLSDLHKLYFIHWAKSEGSSMRRSVFDEDYVTDVLEAMDWEV